MRFIGYQVGNKKFGCSDKAFKKAKEESKKTGKPIEYYSYKI